MFVLHRPRRRRSVDMLRDFDGPRYAVELLGMRFSCRVDGKHISLAQTIKISKKKTISGAIMQGKAAFIDAMQIVRSCVGALKEDCCVCFVYVHILDIV